MQPHPLLPSQSLASQCHQSSTSQASPLPTSRPPSDDTCIPTDPSNHRYICTLCRKEIDGPQNSAARDTQKVCVDCLRRMYGGSICWACGEVVHQKLDAISLRWYWWQPSYFFCLVCRAPRRPRRSFGQIAPPNLGSSYLEEPSLCNRCILQSNSEDEIHCLTNEDPQTPSVTIRPLPKWMKLLPSYRDPASRQPRYSILHRRNSFPYFYCTRYSTPYTTPPEWPTKTDGQNRSLRSPSVLSLAEENEHTAPATLAFTDEPTSPPEAMPATPVRATTTRTDQMPPAETLDAKIRSTVELKAESLQYAPDVVPYKQALYTELSDFFSTRSNKLVLPSRAGGRYAGYTRVLEDSHTVRLLAKAPDVQLEDQDDMPVVQRVFMSSEA